MPDIPVPALTVPTPANRRDSAAILLAQQAEWPDPAQPPRPAGFGGYFLVRKDAPASPHRF